MIGRLRLISGFILTVFVVGHFTNHAVGIVSIKAMNDFTAYTIDPWRTQVGTTVLGLGILVHLGLATWAVWQKRSWRMRRWEIFQIISGFLIPILVSGHVVATRGSNEFFGMNEGYAFNLYLFIFASPMHGVMIFFALLLVWIHACIGWHYWLRLKPWYKSAQLYLFVFAITLPVLALAGLLSAGLRVTRLARNQKWVDRKLEKMVANQPDYSEMVEVGELRTAAILGIIILSTLLIYMARRFLAANLGGARVEYESADQSFSRSLRLKKGQTILELLRDENISHASVCGGRGRCSTCRIRLRKGGEGVSPPSPNEQKVLGRISAPPNVRLACQLKPQSDLTVSALLRPDAKASDGQAITASHHGEEQEIAVLFADLRAFTKLSESKLPYDTAFLLNRYFATMGSAIENGGGHLDKFIGDGVMALFGVNEDLETGCKKALEAAILMSEGLEELNKSLEGELDAPLRIGIGIHCGTAIVGNMGYKHASGLTAIGDVVNTASRLEGMTKEFAVQLIVSQKTFDRAKSGFNSGEMQRVEIRGRIEPLPIIKYRSAKDLRTDEKQKAPKSANKAEE